MSGAHIGFACGFHLFSCFAYGFQHNFAFGSLHYALNLRYSQEFTIIIFRAFYAFSQH